MSTNIKGMAYVETAVLLTLSVEIIAHGGRKVHRIRHTQKYRCSMRCINECAAAMNALHQ